MLQKISTFIVNFFSLFCLFLSFSLSLCISLPLLFKFGGPATLKSSLWRAASSIVDYDVSVISTLALEKGGDASGVVSTLGTAPKGADSKDLLLVIEGEEH
jgi:hypothetical protein